MSLRPQQHPCSGTAPASLHISRASPVLDTKTSESVFPPDALTPVSGSPHPLPRVQHGTKHAQGTVPWGPQAWGAGPAAMRDVPCVLLSLALASLCMWGPEPHRPRVALPWAPPSTRPTWALPCTHCSDMSVTTTGRDQNSARMPDLILPSQDHSKAPSTSAVPPGEGSPRDTLPRSCRHPPATTPAVSMLEPSTALQPATNGHGGHGVTYGQEFEEPLGIHHAFMGTCVERGQRMGDSEGKPPRASHGATQHTWGANRACCPSHGARLRRQTHLLSAVCFVPGPEPALDLGPSKLGAAILVHVADGFRTSSVLQ